ncbi:PspC domain-containing protein [bacterium]
MMKQIYRSTKGKMIAGVLAGFSDTYGINATLLRLIFVLGAVTTGFFPFIFMYLVAWFIMPPDTEKGIIDVEHTKEDNNK